MSSNLFSCQNNPPAAEAEPSVRTARLNSSKSSGIVLLITMVVLLVLVTLGYTLASRVSAQRHRDNYVVDYVNACYARDSAIKYALASLEDLNSIEFVSRPNEPDFSDLFHLSEPAYRQLLEQWAAELAKNQPEPLDNSGEQPESTDLEGVDENGTIQEANDSNGKHAADSNAIDKLKIRGPYGPAWPFVTEPVEFEIGSTTVKIEIEDENAKYPAGWAIIDNEKVQREAQAGLETFCEWMGFDSDQIESVKGQLKQIGAIKPFKVEFKPVVQRTPVTAQAPASARRGARTQRVVYKTTNVLQAELLTKQIKDFSKLFHSSLLDTQMLAAPTIISEDRKESALKYMGLWGTTQVNINSAPRNVLEAAFTFGGDADKIADEIIKKRREKTFANIDELKKELFSFSDSIEKSRPYITTTSNVFAIRVTASSGAAKASAIVVVLKDGGKIERVAIVCG
ncbi:MAG: hypothetical protein ABSG22_03235 [Sedimentisphaerales bacterium]